MDKLKKKTPLSPEESRFVNQAKAKLAKEINQFSMPKMIGSAFKRQIVSGAEAAKTRAAYAAADLLLGQPLKDENGNLVSYFCTAYAMTLLQGTTFLSCFNESEQEMYQKCNRDIIKDIILKRMENHNHALYKVYDANEFMKIDASNTQSYFAGQIFNRAARSQSMTQ